MNHTKSKNIWKLVFSLVWIVLAAAETQLLWRIWKLNMVPGNYFLLLAGAVLAVDGLLYLLFFLCRRGKWEKKRSYFRQIIGSLLCITLSAACFFGSSAVGRVLKTISSITATEKINVILEVYVRADDKANFLQDTAGYTFAISEDVPQEDAGQLLTELESLLAGSVEVRRYPSTAAVVNALTAGEADAVILDSSYLAVLESMEGYDDISHKIKLLHEYVFQKTAPKEEANMKPVTEEVQDVTNTPFLLYISGNDAQRQYLADGGSDVNILVVVNPRDHQILLVNTPRDYYVVNPASGNGSRDKLSHCGLRGIDNCISAMNQLYGLPINYYARINFNGFRTLVDAIGGVTVYSEVDFFLDDYQFHKGENHLNGAEALAFARARKSLAGGDNDRGKNQMRLIKAMIQQLSADNIIANYGEILQSMEGMFSTNLPAEDIGKLVQLQLTQMPSWDILTFAVTGDGGHDYCWGAGGSGYVMYPHEDVVAHAVSLMNRVLNGEVLTQEDLKMNP